MDDDSKKDELKVEQYDAAKAESKRKKILRVAMGAGVAALVAVLVYFGLVQDKNDDEPPDTEPMTEFMCGGNGAWFNSIIVFLGE